jgi:hypothetical protein
MLHIDSTGRQGALCGVSVIPASFSQSPDIEKRPQADDLFRIRFFGREFCLCHQPAAVIAAVPHSYKEF